MNKTVSDIINNSGIEGDADMLIAHLDDAGFVIIPKCLDTKLIERFAIRCAKGNNGGEWATHYTEDQKNVWRTFVSDLIAALQEPKP